MAYNLGNLGVGRRKVMLDAMVEVIKQLRSGRYYVTRGAVNWADFDFEAHPLGAAVVCDESSFLRPQYNTATVTIELMIKLKTSGNESPATVDDLALDAAQAYSNLLQTKRKDADEYPVAERLDLTSDNLIEVSDAQLNVQGVVATVTVNF